MHRVPRDPWNDDPVLQFLKGKGVDVSPFEPAYQILRQRAVEQMAGEVKNQEANLRKEISACRAEIKKRALPRLIPVKREAQSLTAQYTTNRSAISNKLRDKGVGILAHIHTIEQSLNHGTLQEIVDGLVNLDDETGKMYKLMSRLKFDRSLIQCVFDIEAHMNAKEYSSAAEELLKLQLALDIR